MKAKVKTHANSSQEKISRISETEFEIWLKEKPLDGKANTQIIKMLGRELNKPVKIISGFTSRTKLIEIPDIK